MITELLLTLNLFITIIIIIIVLLNQKELNLIKRDRIEFLRKMKW